MDEFGPNISSFFFFFPKKRKTASKKGGGGVGRKKIWRRLTNTKELQQANVQREEVRHVFEKHFLVEL